MNEEQKAELDALAGNMHDKRSIVDAMRMMGTNGKTSQQKKQLTIDYEVAVAEMMESRGRLDRFQRSIEAGNNREGIPFSISETRLAAQKNNIDIHHKELILFLCNEVERIQGELVHSQKEAIENKEAAIRMMDVVDAIDFAERLGEVAKQLGVTHSL
jgi:hypothetical protein